MKKRTQIEAELAQLALEIGGKSHSEAAKAVLDLYKGLALLEAEETIEQQLAAAQQDMQSQLRAKIAELQSEVGVPEIDVPTPAPEAPAAAAPEHDRGSPGPRRSGRRRRVAPPSCSRPSRGSR